MTSYVSAKAEAQRVEVPRGSMRRPERAVYLLAGVALTPLARWAAAHHGLAPVWGEAPTLASLALVAALSNVDTVRRLGALRRALTDRDRPSPPAPTNAPTSREGTGATLARHQLGALVATVTDFAVMTAAVELARWSPAAATALGASAGALTNFTLSRRWVFSARGASVASQAARYAVVSAASLGLNTLGEYALAQRLGVPYLAARALVAVAVSLLWNFPMHRRFVFSATAERAS